MTSRVRAGNTSNQVQNCKDALADGLTRLGVAPRVIVAARCTMENLHWFTTRGKQYDLAWGDVISAVEKGAEFIFVLNVFDNGSVQGCITNVLPPDNGWIGAYMLPASRLIRPVIAEARATTTTVRSYFPDVVH